MKNKFFYVFLISIFGFVGCSGNKNLLGEWQIESLKKDEIYQTLAISDFKAIEKANEFFVAGNSGVNFFNGKIKNKGKNKISIENLATTRMAGGPEETEFENLFLETLSGILSVNIQDDILTLTNSEKKLELKFRKKTENLNEKFSSLELF